MRSSGVISKALETWAPTTPLSVVGLILPVLMFLPIHPAEAKSRNAAAKLHVSGRSAPVRVAQATGRAGGANGGVTDSASYIVRVVERIKHYWSPAKAGDARATVAFRIGKDGRISWVELTDAFNVDSVNNAAEDAINAAAPFPALPASYGDHLDLAVSFDSNYTPAREQGYCRPVAGDLTLSHQLLSYGRKHLSSGNWRDALRDLEQAKQKTPFDGRVKDALIETYLAAAKGSSGDDVLGYLHQAVLVAPDRDSVRATLNEAVKVSGVEPGQADKRVELAAKYLKQSKYDDAMCELGEAWLLTKDAGLSAQINDVCAKRRNFQTVKKWKNALMVSETAENHLACGQAYEACGDSDGAIHEYEAALLLDPVNQNAEKLMNDLKGKPAAPLSAEAIAAAAIDDEFPFTRSAKASVSAAVIKDRRFIKDYLKEACSKQVIRWAVNRIPIKVYIETPNGVVGYKSQFNQYMMDAMKAWEKASEGRIRFVQMTSPRGANITVRWTAEPDKVHMGGEQGVTRFQYLACTPNNATVQGADIYIVTLARGTRIILPDVTMKAVCLHELGHALGIAGHSPYRVDVMYPSVSSNEVKIKLTEQDAATIKRLYQAYTHPH